MGFRRSDNLWSARTFQWCFGFSWVGGVGRSATFLKRRVSVHEPLVRFYDILLIVHLFRKILRNSFPGWCKFTCRPGKATWRSHHMIFGRIAVISGNGLIM